MSAFPFYLAFTTPLLLWAGAWLGGAFVLLPVALVFVLLPVLDEGVGRRGSAAALPRSDRLRFDEPLWLWIPAAFAATLGVLASLPGRPLPEAVGLLVSLGVMNGAGGITIAHELMHRRGRPEQAGAELLMTLVSYPHFCVEHVHGHHRNVATPDDPATSRLGEGLYAFLLRCIPASLVSAWRLEGERVRRTGAGFLGDRRLRHPLLLAAAYSCVAWAWGVPGALAFLLQGAVAIGLLEAVNYLEHYGLQRRELPGGGFEAVRAEHSWNSGHRLSNWYLFNLARHSDHHAQASLPYHQLRDREDPPQLPAGYASMLLLSFVPPLWFRVMDPRVRAWRCREAAGYRSTA
jgi:alkane 1-monooxygenase